MSNLTIEPVESRATLDEFIQLPNRLYKGHKGFVPQLTFERRLTLRFDKNPYFQHAEGRYFLARRDGRVVGRISAQVDQMYLQRYKDATGHFGMIDAEDDPAIFTALFKAAEDWLRGKGMKRAAGPFNLSINEETGVLVSGFDERSVLLMGYNPAYIGVRVEGAGYAKLKDLIAYDYDIMNSPPTIGRKLVERYAAGRVKLRKVNMKNFAAELHTLLDIFNDAWQDNWGFVPLTEAEVKLAAKTMKPLVVPDLVWFAELDGVPMAMILGLPNVNEAIGDLNGKLLPFGWAKLLWRLKVKGLKSSRVPLMGVRMSLRNTPLGAAMAMMVIDELRANGRRRGIEHSELGWILENNAVVRRMIEQVGGVAYKTYRLYDKALA
ncbi:MAG: dATP pyrophosphohydrolase, partial [Rhodospirillales bacterium]